MLSNFEVLTLVNEQQELQRAAQERDPSLEFPENLRTIQFEVRRMLDRVWIPCYLLLEIVDGIFEQLTLQYSRCVSSTELSGCIFTIRAHCC